MKKFLFSSKLVQAGIVAGVIAALPVTAASAATTSSSTTSSTPKVTLVPASSWTASESSTGTTPILITLKGTTVLGTLVPVVGTQDYVLTLPVSAGTVPASVWAALDFTVEDSVVINGQQVLYLYLDPHMVK